MPASASPNNIASRRALRERPRRVGRHSSKSASAANPVRTNTVPAGPSSSNSVVAIAAPIWTEAIAPMTRVIDVARSERFKPTRLATGMHPARVSAGALSDRAYVPQELAQQLRVLDQASGAEELVLHPAARGLAELSPVLAIPEQLTQGVAHRLEVEGIIEQYAALAIDDLVLDAAPLRGDHRSGLPHRLGDRESETLGQALLDDDVGPSLDGVDDRRVLLHVVHGQDRQVNSPAHLGIQLAPVTAHLGQDLSSLRVVGDRGHRGAREQQVGRAVVHVLHETAHHAHWIMKPIPPR